jgi:hypothetical protein
MIQPGRWSGGLWLHSEYSFVVLSACLMFRLALPYILCHIPLCGKINSKWYRFPFKFYRILMILNVDFVQTPLSGTLSHKLPEYILNGYPVIYPVRKLILPEYPNPKGGRENQFALF